MRQRINIYISKLALEELDRLAQAEGKSRGALMEGLVLGARDVEARLSKLESAAGQPRSITYDQLEESHERAVASGEPEPGSEEMVVVEPPKSGLR